MSITRSAAAVVCVSAIWLLRLPELAGQAPRVGVAIGQYQLDKTTAGGRERVWVAGPRFGVPVLGDRAEVAAAVEYGVWRNVRQAPHLLSLRAEFVQMGRSNAAAEVRPTIVGGISVIYFRSTVFAQSLIGPPLGFTQTSWQVVGVGGLGFTIQLNPAVAIAPRVEGLVPFARTVDDPESGVYLRWAVNLGWRL